MSDQKEMKRRLKVLMQKPENQVCSDCPERQPRWASLIVPPPGSPPGATKIGAFCCLECSGSHRRLGVHISFVRSVNLDSWKEAEVLAMENGGNKKVNTIWEASLQKAGGQKPSIGADLTTRERYIREKYERRRFYDPQALIDYQNNEPSIDDIGSKNQGGDFANFGPPPEAQVSDAARLRAEKKKKGPLRNKSFDAPTRSASTESNEGAAGRRRTKKQEAEPQPVVDLLDFGGGAPALSANGIVEAPFADFFSADAASGVAVATKETPRRKSSRDGSRSRSKTRDQLRTKSKTPDREKSRQTQQQDILNMYNTPASMGAGVMNPTAAANSQVNMMAMMQQMQQMNMNAQPQLMQPMGGMQDPSGSKHNARLVMHQNLMMQQMRAQWQQQQLNMQQMQRMAPPVGGMNSTLSAGAVNPQMMQFGVINPQMVHANTGRMPNMPMNMNPNMMGMNPSMMGMTPNMMGMMTGLNPNMVQQQQQPHNMNMNHFGGMPVGPNATTNMNQTSEKEDPFAQFGMNAFR